MRGAADRQIAAHKAEFAVRRVYAEAGNVIAALVQRIQIAAIRAQRQRTRVIATRQVSATGLNSPPAPTLNWAMLLCSRLATYSVSPFLLSASPEAKLVP